jgi:hypothetical protein
MANGANQAIAELNAGAERFKAVVTDIKLKEGPPVSEKLPPK